MPDWLRRMLRTALQASAGTLVWAAVRLLFLPNVTMQQDAAVILVIGVVSTALLSGLQNAAENTWPQLAFLKPEAQVLNAHGGHIPNEGSK